MANKDHFCARLRLARAAVAPKVPVAYLFIPERGHFHIRAILEEDLLPRVRRGADSVNSTDTNNQENQSLGNRPLQPSKSLTEQNQGLDAHVSEDFTDLTRRQNLTH